jgi:ribosomal protein S17
MTSHKTDSSITMNAVRANVVSVSKDGHTAKVEIPTVVVHEKYGKRLRRETTLLVDTGEHLSLQVGSIVNILPSRRVSKRKSWAVASVAAEKK